MPLGSLPAFRQDDVVNVVIESPRGSRVKLKYSPELDAFTISRPLVEGVCYPFDWGFVPSTRAADGDPMDAMVLWDVSSFPGVVIPCRIVGGLAVEQNSRTKSGSRERNDRLFCVPVSAARFDELTDVSALPARMKREIEQFFIAATALEAKDLAVLGWATPADALALLQAAIVNR